MAFGAIVLWDDERWPSSRPSRRGGMNRAIETIDSAEVVVIGGGADRDDVNHNSTGLYQLQVYTVPTPRCLHPCRRQHSSCTSPEYMKVYRSAVSSSMAPNDCVRIL